MAAAGVVTSLLVAFSQAVPPAATEVRVFDAWWMHPQPTLRCVADPPLDEVIDTGQPTTIGCFRRTAFEIVRSPLGEADGWVPEDPYAPWLYELSGDAPGEPLLILRDD